MTFGDSIASIAAPHTAAKLVIGMLSIHMSLRSEYVMFSILCAMQRPPTHHYFGMGIYYQELLRGGIVFASVRIYEAGSGDVECVEFTCIMFTSLYSRIR